jgi:CheY-like chemotaxis protein
MDSPEDIQAQRGLRVLVIDDCADTVETMAMVLCLYGHEVRTAADGPTALRLAQEQMPDVVLLDIGLPGMDGWEVASRLKALKGPGGKAPVLIMVSGYGQEVDLRRSEDRGIDHHLIKPADMEELQQLQVHFQESIRRG